MDKNKKQSLYSIISILLGVFKLSSEVFKALFVQICFPPDYNGNFLLIPIAFLLIIAGVSNQKQKSGTRRLFRIIAIGLALDLAIRLLFYIHEALSIEIVSELVLIIFYLLISFDYDINYDTED